MYTEKVRNSLGVNGGKLLRGGGGRQKTLRYNVHACNIHLLVVHMAYYEYIVHVHTPGKSSMSMMAVLSCLVGFH